MKKLCSFLMLLSVLMQAQSPFIYPLKGKPVLNGNYGEVRPNHFHAGIDFRTHYSNHLPIYAVADGYVSRIKVSTTGYGKVLYVTHTNGLVSVYGHEYGFADKIKTYVENAQEIAEVFEIELMPKPNELPVKQGEVIGYTGNTGSSEGPHLHFEIRDEKTEAPLNPLRYLKVEDLVAPKIQRLALYGFYKLDKIISPPKKTDTLTLTQATGFGLDCFDFEQPNQGSKNNIYKAEIYVDGKLYYKHIIDSIPFDVARYVNTYSDYDVKKQQRITIQKLFKEKNNELPIYKIINEQGFIYFKDAAYHAIKIVVYDFYNQKDEISFTVKTVPSTKMKESYGNLNNCLEPFKASTADYNIELPAKSLYEDAELLLSYKNNTLYFTAARYDIPLQNNCSISLKVPANLTKYGNKLCMANITANSKSYVDAIYKDGFVKGNSKLFGAYKVDVDTVSPQIKLAATKKSFYKENDVIAFKVSDSYSGIGVFKLYLNGKWHLAEYESKTNSIFFTITEKTPKGNVILNLQLSDKKSNQTNFTTTLIIN